MKGVLKYASRILSSPIMLMSYLFPRNRRIWVFGAWFGRSFSDNPKYLFLHCLNSKKVRPIWIGRSDEAVRQVREIGGEAYKAHSLAGWFYQSVAKVAVINVDTSDLVSPLLGGATMVQLWHGMPLKRIGMDDDRFEPSKDNTVLYMIRKLRNTMMLREWRRYRVFPVPSKNTTAIFDKAFCLKHPSEVLGFPRYDAFVQQSDNDAFRRSFFKFLNLPEDRKLVLYMPTHRKEGKSAPVFMPLAGLDIASLDEQLEAMNAVLLYKAHFYHNNTSALDLRSILNISEYGFDVQRLLAIADILVTDFSSCYFDFLNTGRPIIFIKSDIENYVSSERGLYFDYDDVTPGRKVVDHVGFIQAMQEYFQDPSIDRDARIKVNSIFNEIAPGTASARVCDRILEIIHA